MTSVFLILASNVHSIPNPNSISKYFRFPFHSKVVPNSFPFPNYRRNGLEFHFLTPNRQKFRCIWFGNGNGKIDNARCWLTQVVKQWPTSSGSNRYFSSSL